MRKSRSVTLGAVVAGLAATLLLSACDSPQSGNDVGADNSAQAEGGQSNGGGMMNEGGSRFTFSNTTEMPVSVVPASKPSRCLVIDNDSTAPGAFERQVPLVAEKATYKNNGYQPRRTWYADTTKTLAPSPAPLGTSGWAFFANFEGGCNPVDNDPPKFAIKVGNMPAQTVTFVGPSSGTGSPGYTGAYCGDTLADNPRMSPRTVVTSSYKIYVTCTEGAAITSEHSPGTYSVDQINIVVAPAGDTDYRALRVGEFLSPAYRLESPGGRFRLELQSDNNLVYSFKKDDGTYQVLGESGTTGGKPNSGQLTMQPDGNLVLYREGRAVWAQKSDWGSDSALYLTRSGALVLGNYSLVQSQSVPLKYTDFGPGHRGRAYLDPLNFSSCRGQEKDNLGRARGYPTHPNNSCFPYPGQSIPWKEVK